MTVQLRFDGSRLPAGRFLDWIVVGTTNRPECRLQGNGELQYVIEIAVMNDPCGTQMVGEWVSSASIVLSMFSVGAGYTREHHQNRAKSSRDSPGR